MAQKIKAETAAQREKRGAANPRRTQDARDRASFFRYAQKHPEEMIAFARFIVEEASDESKLIDAGWREVLVQVVAEKAA